MLQLPQKPKKGRLNYANLQDKYILILLQYKLMLQLSDQIISYKNIRIQEYKNIKSHFVWKGCPTEPNVKS